MNKRLLAVAEEKCPDLIWVDKGLFIRPRTLREIKARLSTTLVNYNNDDPFGAQRVGWRWFLEGIPVYDAVCTPRSISISEYRQRGAAQVIKFSWAYNPETHAPQRMTPEEREKLGGSIGFIGDYERERADSIRYLASRGLPVRIWGERWRQKCPPSPGLRIEGRPVWAEEYAKAICSFDICLGFLRKVNRDLSTTRSVEIPACGGFLLAERTAEHLSLFEEGEEADFFGSEQELFEKAEYYLAHPEERARIAANGRERCLRSGYSEKEVLADILKQLPISKGKRL